jgi:hypothetical protein
VIADLPRTILAGANLLYIYISPAFAPYLLALPHDLTRSLLQHDMQVVRAGWLTVVLSLFQPRAFQEKKRLITGWLIVVLSMFFNPEP